MLRFNKDFLRGYRKHNNEEIKNKELSNMKFSEIDEQDLCNAKLVDLKRFMSEIGESYQYRKSNFERQQKFVSRTKHEKLYLSKAQILSTLIRRKREERGDMFQPQQTNKKRKNVEIEEVAWKEEIENRKDGRIFNQYSGFTNDAAIRAWEFPTGIAPMRRCSCDMCNLHGRRRTEYLLCSITQGRHDTYNLQDMQKHFEAEGLDRFVPEGQLRTYISEACRNKTVLLSRPAPDRLEEAVDPKVPIGIEIGIEFHACKYCNVIQHVNYRDFYKDKTHHLPTCVMHPTNHGYGVPMGRRLHRDTSSEEETEESLPIMRFTCNEPHSEKCPFNLCRNADRYLPLATQRGKKTQDLRIADFTCSLRCDAELADALAKRKEDKKEYERNADWNMPELGFICQIHGCELVGDKKFDSRHKKTGKGTYIEHICNTHSKRLKNNKNRLSSLWTQKELADDSTRQCSYSPP